MEQAHLLLIEDDTDLAEMLVRFFRLHGHELTVAHWGEQGITLAAEERPDLILLDIRLPDISGFDVCRRLRAQGRRMPILMLTARDEEVDKVLGLELGADDYVVKPFSVRELLARVEAVLRRSPERPNRVECVSLPNGVADLARREVRWKNGQRAELSEREVELLRYLAAHAGRAISRAEILLRVWRLDPKRLATRTIDMHVAHLREKLRDDPNDPRVLLTVRGKGYMVRKPED